MVAVTAITVGELKDWLKTLSPPTPELQLPDGLPDSLGDEGTLKNAVNPAALSDWFTMGTTLTGMVPDPDHLCVTGIIATETPNLSLCFFSDEEGDPDDATVTGVQFGLSLKSHPVMSAFSALGCRTSSSATRFTSWTAPPSANSPRRRSSPSTAEIRSSSPAPSTSKPDRPATSSSWSPRTERNGRSPRRSSGSSVWPRRPS
ncbi:glucosamine-6-phosphate deaminase [Streptomyces sp. NBRC 110611]|nr:glucosamine-6-phosphate deaminase [Streptomyces sp. NBRC 110611]